MNTEVPDPTEAMSRRVIIDRVRPRLDDGRFAIKRTVGESVDIVAQIFTDGHDLIAAVLRDRGIPGFGIRDLGFANLNAANGDESARIPNPQSRIPSPVCPWRETPLTPAAPGTDEWTGRFDVEAIGWHEYDIVAWIDRFGSWRRDLAIKARADQDVSVDLLEGALLVRAAAARAEAIGSGVPDASWLLAQAEALSAATPIADRAATAAGGELARLMRLYSDRSQATTSHTSRVWVDRERARVGAWYEMFPRSAGTDEQHGGTFRDACLLLAGIADLGFDVLYLPPIHPIGRSFRKGRNNSLTAGPDDPGSPWAIGSADGGHTAIDPHLGTLDDFASFRRTAERHGLEIALDLAWQCSPDHPWVREHPEWFRHRPDGTIKYAENPPKKYQDIYPFDFACDEWRALWRALLDVTLFWIDQGVRIFRVDNPHTKTFGFWEWAIAEVHAQRSRRDLSRRGVHPPRGDALSGQGRLHAVVHLFHLAEYEAGAHRVLHRADHIERARVSPPEPVRQHAGHPPRLPTERRAPGVQARLLLAATLGASYGIYSGFELCEGRRSRVRRNTPTRKNIRSDAGTGIDPATSKSSSRGSMGSGDSILRCSTAGRCASMRPTTPKSSRTARRRQTAPTWC